MRNHSVTFLDGRVLAGCLILASGAAFGAGGDLRADPRLAARLTLNEPVLTVRRLLAQLPAGCAGKLDAGPALREETVCVAVRDQPCGEVLQQLSEVLGYRWRHVPEAGAPPGPDRSPYLLVEEASTRLRRAALSRQYRREAGRELVAQLDLLDRFTRALGEAAPGEVRDELERLEARVNALPTGPERLQAELEFTAARTSTDPEVKPLLLALGALSPAARERLLDGERLVMATQRPGALPMPERVLRALRAARQAQARKDAVAGGPVVTETEDEAIDFLSHVAWGDLTLYVRARGLPGQPRRLTFAVPTFVQTPSRVAQGSAGSDRLPGTVTADSPELLRTPVAFTWPAKQRDRERPLTYFTGITVAEVLASLAAADPRWQVCGRALLEGLRPGPARGAGPPGAPAAPETASALLTRLSEQSRAGPLRLGELLEPLAERGSVDIQVARGGWIRFRSARPFGLRERQVDPEVLREVFGPAVDAPELSPDAAMAVGRRLTRAQLETLSAEHLGFPRHLTQNSGLRSVVDAWRLLDQLPGPDRQALFAGGVLRYAGLSERGRAAVREYLRSVSARPNGAPLDLEAGLRELPTLQLSLTPVRESVRVLELRLGSAVPPLYTAPLRAEWRNGSENRNDRNSPQRHRGCLGERVNGCAGEADTHTHTPTLPPSVPLG